MAEAPPVAKPAGKGLGKLKAILQRKVFGIPAWVLILAGAAAWYWFYVRPRAGVADDELAEDPGYDDSALGYDLMPAESGIPTGSLADPDAGQEDPPGEDPDAPPPGMDSGGGGGGNRPRKKKKKDKDGKGGVKGKKNKPRPKAGANKQKAKAAGKHVRIIKPKKPVKKNKPSWGARGSSPPQVSVTGGAR